MTGKPQDRAGYSQGGTTLAERGLLEVWRHLGKYHKHMVLVGGLVPRYLVGPPRHGGQPLHCGSLDVDLGVGLAVADEKTYASIRQRLTDSMGFVPGRNAKGNDQRHSFVKHTNEGDIVIYFSFRLAEGGRASIGVICPAVTNMRSAAPGIGAELLRRLSGCPPVPHELLRR
jgi:hypothetical protein